MGIVNVTEAVKLVGSVVIFELAFEDDDGLTDTSFSCVFVAGVVLGLEGVYPHPHFCVYYMDSKTDRYPDQVFLRDIRSYTVVPVDKRKPIKPIYSVSLIGA